MTTEDAPNPRVLSHTEFALLTARPIVRIAFIGALIIIIGAAQGLSHGWSADAIALIIGPVLAFCGVGLYGTGLEIRERSGTAAGLNLTCLIPFAFGCYLTFVRGSWNARGLLGDFFFGLLCGSAALSIWDTEQSTGHTS